MKKIIAVLAFLLCLLLCGCSVYQPEVETLLSAPLLSELQNHVDEALRDVVGQAVKLKYPASGDYRSPYIFYDLNGDGSEEALVLYSLESDTDVTYLQILAASGDTWRAGSALPGSGTEIEFVRFAHILADEDVCIIVGWKDTDTAITRIATYRYKDNAPEKLMETTCSELAIYDFNSDGLDELLSATLFSGTVQLQLLGDNGTGNIDVLDYRVGLQRMTSLLSPVIGEVQPGVPGVVLDGIVNSDCMASLLVGVSNNRLVLPQSDSILSLPNNLWEATWRYTGIRSEDIDGDGQVEIPVGVPAAGYTEGDSSARPQYFTAFCSFNGAQLVPDVITYENIANGYRLILPQSWLGYYADGVLSVYRQTETREVTFFLYDGSLTSRTNELLRLRVVADTDYLDVFDSERYTLLQKRGQFDFYAYLPAVAGLPTLTAEELQQCFALLY